MLSYQEGLATCLGYTQIRIAVTLLHPGQAIPVAKLRHGHGIVIPTLGEKRAIVAAVLDKRGRIAIAELEEDSAVEGAASGTLPCGEQVVLTFLIGMENVLADALLSHSKVVARAGLAPGEIGCCRAPLSHFGAVVVTVLNDPSIGIRARLSDSGLVAIADLVDEGRAPGNRRHLHDDGRRRPTVARIALPAGIAVVAVARIAGASTRAVAAGIARRRVSVVLSVSGRVPVVLGVNRRCKRNQRQRNSRSRDPKGLHRSLHQINPFA